MHETELAVIVAGLHAVEHGGVHLRSQRRTSGLVDGHREQIRAASHRQGDLGAFSEQLPADHVARPLAVDGGHLVACSQPCALSRRSGRYSDDLRC